MADASGTHGGTEVFETLMRTKRGRGVVFRSPEREGPAKLRQRAVRSLCKFIRVGAFIRVAWRYETSSEVFIWDGEVVGGVPASLQNFDWANTSPIWHNHLSGAFRVRYAKRPNTTLPFPPYSQTGVVLCATQVRNPARAKWKSNRHRPRPQWASTGKHAQQDSENHKGSAEKESTTVATLNVTTLKLEGEDEFALRRCARLNEVLAFMHEKGVGVMCLQETRHKFLKGNHEDGILYRKVENLGECFHIYLQSADERDSYNGMAIISRWPFQKVWMVSKRVMERSIPWKMGRAHCLMSIPQRGTP